MAFSRSCLNRGLCALALAAASLCGASPGGKTAPQGGLVSAAAVAPYELLQNGGFESGNTGWTSAGARIQSYSYTHSGSWIAAFNGRGTTNSESLRQQFTIPASATSAQLNFWLYIYSTESASNRTTYFYATVHDGTTQTTLDYYTNINTYRNSGYRKKTFDLSAYRGKTISVIFYGNENASSTGYSGFILDDVSVVAQVDTTPIVSSFSPASGVPGTAVTLDGSFFTGATAVKFNGASAAFTVASASQITATVPADATTGPISVTTPSGTGTSASSFTVNPNPNAPSVTGFSPASGKTGDPVTVTGLRFTGATAVKFNGTAATFTVASDSQINTTVPAGAASGPITVTTAQGTGASAASFNVTNPATVDFSITKVLVGQATQRSNNSMRLAQDKRGFVRVFLKASATNTLRPTVRAQFFNGATQVYETTIQPPASLTGVPTTVAEGDFPKTWIDVIPANVFKPGLSVKVTVDPNNQVPDTNRANNVYPASGNLALTVRNTYPFRIMFVPLQIYYGGYYTGRVDSTNVDRFLDMFQRIWPVPEAIDRMVHSAYYTQNIPMSDYSYGWEAVLNELGALQRAEGRTNRYYYGVYNPYYGSGGTGMAWLSSPQSMGIDWTSTSADSSFSWRAGTVAHEVGHSLSRPHSPCGGAGSPDPYYPYSNGLIGTYGYDCWTKQYYPLQNYDVMGYCGYLWVSDYCVDKVMDFRISYDSTVPGPIGPTAGPAEPEMSLVEKTKPETCTLVWGTVEHGVVKLNPAFTIQSVPDRNAENAPYQVELVSASGQVIGSAALDPLQSDHGTGHRGFVMAVPPLKAAHGPALVPGAPTAETLASIRIHDRNGQIMAIQKGTQGAAEALAAAPESPAAAKKARALRTKDGRVRLLWDAQAYPMVMVKNAAGEVISFAKDGDVSLPAKDDVLEVHFSDGIRSHPEKVSVE